MKQQNQRPASPADKTVVENALAVKKCFSRMKEEEKEISVSFAGAQVKNKTEILDPKTIYNAIVFLFVYNNIFCFVC